MKKIITIFLLFSLTSHTYSQTPNWLWAEAQNGGGCYVSGNFILAGPSGKLYVTGRVAGTMTLGGKSITAPGLTNVFAGKMDASGNLSWINARTSTNGVDYNYGSAIDKDENTYTTGLLQALNAMYLDKYDSGGNKIWSLIITGNTSGYGIAIDNNANVYLTGHFNGSLTIGNNTITAIGNTNIFLAKFNKDGICQWVKSATGRGTDGGRAAAVDHSGNVFICGGYSDSLLFGSIKIPRTNNSSNFFIAKYDSSGNVEWVSTAPNAGFEQSYAYWSYNALAIDSSGNLLVTGHFIDTAQFGNTTLISNGGDDIFVAKCLNSGQWQWAKSAGGSGLDWGIGITLDEKQDVYIGGEFSGPSAQFGSKQVTTSATESAFAAKYSNSAGNLLWVQTNGGTASSAASGITVDGQGFVYLTGFFNSGNATFGATNLTGLNSCGNIFIAKLDTTPSVKPACQAYFTLYPDSTTPHNWFALNQSTGATPIGYTWSWGDGSSSTGLNPSHTYASAGYYNICVTINDDTLCTSTYCDSSAYLFRKDEDNTVVNINVVSSLATNAASISSSIDHLIIYPNPCSTCELKGITSEDDLIVNDLLGRTIPVNFVKTPGGFALSFADNRTGMYLLKNVKTGEVAKFIRE